MTLWGTFNRDLNISNDRNAFENVISKMATNFPWPQYVLRCYLSHFHKRYVRYLPWALNVTHVAPQRTHGATATSLIRQNDLATSFNETMMLSLRHVSICIAFPCRALCHAMLH